MLLAIHSSLGMIPGLRLLDILSRVPFMNVIFSRNPSAHDANWSPVISNDFEYLHITTKQDEMKKELLKERYEFWKSLQVIPPFKASNMPKFKDEL